MPPKMLKYCEEIAHPPQYENQMERMKFDIKHPNPVVWVVVARLETGGLTDIINSENINLAISKK